MMDIIEILTVAWVSFKFGLVLAGGFTVFLLGIYAVFAPMWYLWGKLTSEKEK